MIDADEIEKAFSFYLCVRHLIESLLSMADENKVLQLLMDICPSDLALGNW